MLYETTYSYAGFDIDASVDDEGNYFISAGSFDKITQTRLRDLLDSKRLNPILGKSPRTAICSSKTTKSSRKKTFLRLSDFLAIMSLLAQPYDTGNKVTPSNPHALAFVIAGFASDFTTTLKAHFGETMDEEQKEYLRQLVFNRIEGFKSWCDIIHSRHVKFYGEKPEGWYYGKLIKRANQSLFGVANFGNDRTSNMTTEQQETIKEFELFLLRKSRNNQELEPEALLDLALTQFTS